MTGLMCKDEDSSAMVTTMREFKKHASVMTETENTARVL